MANFLRNTVILCIVFLSVTNIHLFSHFFQIRAQSSGNTVIINELMPNPVAPETELEWIELYNYGNTEVNLSGWKLDGATLGDIEIQADSYIILARNSVSLKTKYPSLQNVFEISFSLTNSADTVILQNPVGNYTDLVSYSSTLEEISLERQGPIDNINCKTLINHPSSNSIEYENIARDDNCFETDFSQEPEISKIIFSTDEVSWSENIFSVGDTEIFFDYELSGIDQSVINEIWQLSDGSVVESPFEFSNYISSSLNLVIELEDGTFLTKTSEDLSIYPSLEINEIMPDYNTTQSSVNSIESEWLEIYNPNLFAVNLENYYISASNLNLEDSLYLSESKEISDSSILTCGEILEIPAESYCIFIPDQLNFFPDEEGTVVLEIDSQQTDLQVEQVFYQSINTGNTYSKYRGGWFEGLPETVGKENIYPKTIQISELFPTPDSSLNQTEWIEIYNYGEFPVNLSGWYLRDRGSMSEFGTTKSYLPENYIIQPGDYLVVADPNLLISLNNSGDRVTLFNKFDEVMDSFLYDSITTGESASRVFNTEIKSYITDYSSSSETNFVPISTIPTPNIENKFESGAEMIFSNILTTKTKQRGEKVAVEGYVSATSGTFAEDVFYIADNLSGIKIDLANNLSVDLELGQNVRILGTMSESGNERKINVSESKNILTEDMTGSSLGESEIKVYEVKQGDDWENLEGRLISASGEIIDNFASSFDIESVNGVVRVSILNSTGIDIQGKKTGDTVAITGILIQDGDIYKILPRFQSDVSIFLNTADSSASSDQSSKEDDTTSAALQISGDDVSTLGVNATNYEYLAPSLTTLNLSETQFSSESSSGYYLWPFFLVAFLITAVFGVYYFGLWTRFYTWIHALSASDNKLNYFPERKGIKEVIERGRKS